jgi:hypothetical protein
MGTECFATVRGSTIRVTALTARGMLPGEGPVRYAVSRSVARVSVNEVSDSGSGGVLRDEHDQPRIGLPDITDGLGYSLDADLMRVDPGLLNLMLAVPLATDAAGNVVGFDASTRLPLASFALEVWSKLTGEVCKDGQRWGYTLFPYLRGGVLGGVTFNNGLVSFGMKRSMARKGSLWGPGPYDMSAPFERLWDPVSRNDWWTMAVTDVPPPDQTDGIVEFTDVLSNGSATNPMPYPAAPASLAGGSAAATSGWIVSGGGA